MIDVETLSREGLPRGNAAPRVEMGTAKRFVVIAPQGLGDTLEATPMLQALRDVSPAAHIVVIVMRPQAGAVIRGLPDLADDVVELPFWEKGAVAFASAASRLPFRRASDAAFLAYPAARPAYAGLLNLVPARRRYLHSYRGPSWRRLVELRTIAVEVRAVPNAIRNLDLLRAHGFQVDAPERYAVPQSWLADHRADHRIIMHVGTVAHDGLEARRWPEPSFAELGRRMVRHGYELHLIAGPDEIDATRRVAAEIPGAIIESAPLQKIARLIASSRCVVANDNGIAHLAAGVGTPVLALFGPTPPEHGPYGPGAIAFRPSPCPPCFDIVRTDTTCKLGIDYRCLKADLPVPLVEERILRLLRETEPLVTPGT